MMAGTPVRSSQLDPAEEIQVPLDQRCAATQAIPAETLADDESATPAAKRSRREDCGVSVAEGALPIAPAPATPAGQVIPRQGSWVAASPPTNGACHGSPVAPQPDDLPEVRPSPFGGSLFQYRTCVETPPRSDLWDCAPDQLSVHVDEHTAWARDLAQSFGLADSSSGPLPAQQPAVERRDASEPHSPDSPTQVGWVHVSPIHISESPAGGSSNLPASEERTVRSSQDGWVHVSPIKLDTDTDEACLGGSLKDLHARWCEV